MRHPFHPSVYRQSRSPSLKMKPNSLVNPAELAGRLRETQTVSDTTTESVFNAAAFALNDCFEIW